MTDALWYAGRGSGLISLVLLSLVVVLGIATRSGRPLPGLSPYVVTAVHRSAGLLSVVFLLVHVVTLLFDPYAQLDLIALVVPFTAASSPFWYGLGALALDLLAAVTVTSLLRTRLGPRTWRGVHYLAYACWPIAVLHGVGSGSDTTTAWSLTVLGICVAGVLGAVGWRLSERFGQADRPAAGRAPGRGGRSATTLPEPTTRPVELRP
ncbi:ferric reductase-like transmembrane domain-containing protein [Pseudonocardia ailaonensis]|uniref:Ferric reductase-like transmembrane domain-containing protein n=1 Tax=Pseudonocardia ailaonensis TaxID=367279 RepID=A0ABN2N259_9PSEU